MPPAVQELVKGAEWTQDQLVGISRAHSQASHLLFLGISYFWKASLSLVSKDLHPRSFGACIAVLFSVHICIKQRTMTCCSMWMKALQWKKQRVGWGNWANACSWWRRHGSLRAMYSCRHWANIFVYTFRADRKCIGSCSSDSHQSCIRFPLNADFQKCHRCDLIFEHIGQLYMVNKYIIKTGLWGLWLAEFIIIVVKYETCPFWSRQQSLGILQLFL